MRIDLPQEEIVHHAAPRRLAPRHLSLRHGDLLGVRVVGTCRRGSQLCRFRPGEVGIPRGSRMGNVEPCGKTRMEPSGLEKLVEAVIGPVSKATGLTATRVTTH